MCDNERGTNISIQMIVIVRVRTLITILIIGTYINNRNSEDAISLSA